MNPLCYKTHVCMVSEQPLANLLPVLIPGFKPKQVLMLVTPEMNKEAQQLEKVLQQRGCRTRQYPVAAFDYDAVRAIVSNLILEHSHSDLVFNLTGGTKIMSLAVYEVVREFGLPSFYLDTPSQQLIMLYVGAEPVPLPEMLTVKAALTARGFDIESSGSLQVSPRQINLTEQLVRRADEFQKPLAQLNFLAQNAKNKLQMPKDIPASMQNSQAGVELLSLFKQAGVLIVDRGQLVFSDEAGRFYVNGGWLEQHCLSVVRQLKQEGKLYDLLPNVKVQSSDGVKNEIDLALTARNRLHIIECKTANMSKPPDNDRGETSTANISYKLETLRELTGGSFGKALLITYQPLREADRVRCSSYNIKVIETRQLQRLREEILRWIT